MTAPPRVNGAHHPPPGRNRSWRFWAAVMAAVFVVTFIAGFTLAAASRSQPEPVSAAAGARTAAVPTTPYTGGMGSPGGRARRHDHTGMRTVTCAAVVGPIWKLGGEVCRCVLPAAHVFVLEDHWHRCDCGTTWVDDQQIDEARRCRDAGRPYLGGAA